jgi:hypothetical protein
VNDDAFFSILQMNQIIIPNQDKNELIRYCRVQSNNGPGPGSGAASIDFRRALAMIVIDWKNS